MRRKPQISGDLLKRLRLKKNLARAGLNRAPENDEDGMAMFIRGMGLAADRWRGCREPGCRRHRFCTAPRVSCSNKRVSRSMSEEKAAANKARAYRALQRELERRGLK